MKCSLIQASSDARHTVEKFNRVAERWTFKNLSYLTWVASTSELVWIYRSRADMHPTDSRNPVVLVHGIDDTSKVFNAMSVYLRSQNWTVYTVDLTPCCGRAGLDTLAEQLQSFIERTFAPDQTIDLVGFSMGGIVSRYYVQRLGGLERVQRFVTLSSPHNGTWTAYFRQNLGASQMRPSSMFLQDLNRDIEMLCRVNFTSMWTPYDLMIVPSHSSRLPVGREIMMSVPTHSWMIRSSQSLQRLTEILQEPPVALASRDS